VKVMGLDLSLTGTGVVVLNYDGTVAEHITVSSKLRDMERLAYIRSMIGTIVSKHNPSLTCIEGYSMGSRAGQLASIGELGGVIKLLLFRNDFRFQLIPPSQLKKFVTGKGVGIKDEVMMHVYKRWEWTPVDNNQADAYGLSRIALALEEIDINLIVPQREVIDAIRLASLEKTTKRRK